MSETEGDTDAVTGRDEMLLSEPKLEGQLLAGRHRIARRLGQGATATVYRGEQVETGRQVAIRVLRQAYADDPEAVERFLRAARTTAKIRHPHVVEVIDFGRVNGVVFVVMELLAGEDLLAHIEGAGGLAWPEACAIGLQLCAALQAASAAGIGRCEVRPENCFWVHREDGEVVVKVLDFSGAIATPERDEAADEPHGAVYSLGVTLYHALTGESPFGPAGAAADDMFSLPRSLRAVAPAADIPGELETIVLRALETTLSLRFHGVDEVAMALLSFGTDHVAAEASAEAVRPAPSLVGRAREHGGTAAKLMLVAAGVVVAVMVMWPMGQVEPPPPTTVVTPPVAPMAVAAVEEPEPSPTVTLHVEARPSARVRDAATGAELGRTGDPAGLALPRSDQARELVLTAEGYEDTRVTVVPDRNQSLTAVLKKKKKRRGASKKASKRTPEPAAAAPPPTG